jgi:hypothetical protein
MSAQQRQGQEAERHQVAFSAPPWPHVRRPGRTRCRSGALFAVGAAAGDPDAAGDSGEQRPAELRFLRIGEAEA